jgi:hypothetical protein
MLCVIRSYYKYYLVMQHLNVAIKYIDHSGLGDGEATGGSWKSMHPKYQRRIFFWVVDRGRDC